MNYLVYIATPVFIMLDTQYIKLYVLETGIWGMVIVALAGPGTLMKPQWDCLWPLHVADIYLWYLCIFDMASYFRWKLCAILPVQKQIALYCKIVSQINSKAASSARH